MPALALLTSLAVVTGHVETTESRWSDDHTIVTESTVRSTDGSIVTVVQLGGTVDGVGMRFSHLPSPLRRGDDVELTGAYAGARLIVRTVRAGGSSLAAPASGTAAYGLERTTASKKALYRASGCIAVIYDEAGTAQLPHQLAFATLDLAFQQWTGATTSCSALEFHRSSAPDVPTARDGVDTVHFRDDRWCRPANGDVPEVCYPQDVAAMTRLTFVDIPGDPEDGKILDADIEINAVNFALQVDGATPKSSGTPIDLLSVVTHEVGHSLGLAHNCGVETEEWPSDQDGRPVPACAGADAAHIAATMFVQVSPGDTSKRTLETTDTVGACAAVSGQQCELQLTGGCSSTRPSSGPLLGVAAFVLFNLLQRRRRLARAHTSLRA